MSSARTIKKSWADMHSDDSSMGAALPSMVRKKDESGNVSVQLPKGHSGSSAGKSSFSVVCDDSYAAGGIENKKANVLHEAMKDVQISKNEFSCFGFLLPKSDETFDADTRSRMMSNMGGLGSSEESRLGKRLLSAVSGGQSDFSSMMMEHGAEIHVNQANKVRKVDGVSNPVPTSFSTSEPNGRAQGTPQPSEAEDSQWEARFLQRERQVELTKAGSSYQNYIKKIPISKRSHNDPQTPNSRDMSSKRQFDGKLLKWRKQLKQFDEAHQ